MMTLPTSVEPVNAIFAAVGCVMIAARSNRGR
jgi:hypothetical protein